MKALKYLIVPWVVIAVYSVVSLLYGAMGLSSYKQLLWGRDYQRANLKKLGLINAELEKAQNSLLYDHDAIEVYARQLGYSRENEQFIRIVGLRKELGPYSAVGETVTVPEPGFIADLSVKFIALFAGFVVLALLALHDFLQYKRKQPF
jgi:cell division protein FtsB